MSFQFLIVGGGLAGAAIALQIRARGHRVVMFDAPHGAQASRVAAGLFNPIAGQALAKSWRADQVFPYLHTFYSEAEKTTGVKFLHAMPVCIPLRTIEEQNMMMGQSATDPFIEEVYSGKRFSDYIHETFGGVIVKHTGFLNTNQYLDSVRDWLLRDGSYVPGEFNYAALEFAGDEVIYGSHRARAIIFCEGFHVSKNPLFGWVPITPLKGETLDVELRREPPCIFNRGVYVVPTGQPGVLGGKIYRVGATYLRDTTPGVTQGAKAELETGLRNLLRSNFRIRAQSWGIRPTVRDRKPMMGPHPVIPNAFIFNGLGTKGVSFAPYCSNQLVEHILGGAQIDSEVNISRFYALYSKS